jgi:hypothetical protein
MMLNVNVLMVTTNILALFYFGIMYLTYYFQTYKICITTITKIKGKTQPKMHYKIHICTIKDFTMN